MPLICSFAYRHSRRDRIERWIAHLERLADQKVDDPSFAETVEILLLRARSWLAEAAGAAPPPAGVAGD